MILRSVGHTSEFLAFFSFKNSQTQILYIPIPICTYIISKRNNYLSEMSHEFLGNSLASVKDENISYNKSYLVYNYHIFYNAHVFG